MPMEWEQLGMEAGFAWIAERRANAWFAEAARLMAPENWATKPTVETIVAAWRALSYGYQCCDLSPWAEPSYRAEMLRAYGRARPGPIGGERNDQSPHWLNSTGTGWSEAQEREADAYAAANPGHDYDRVNVGDYGGRFARQVYDEYTRLNPGDHPRRFFMVVQCALAKDGVLSQRCVNGPDGVANSDCDFPYRTPNCTGPWGQPPPAWAPKCMAWRHWFNGDTVCLPPMTDGGSADIVRAVAMSCAARGARAVVEDGYKNAALLNLATAHRLGLLPEELMAVAAHVGDEWTRWNGNGPRSHDVDVEFLAIEAAAAVFATATTAANAPWLGAVVGLGVGAADMFFNLVGEPAMIVTDQFGQVEPIFQTYRVSGSPGTSEASQPRQVIPDPPDYHRGAGSHITLPSLLALFPSVPSGAPPTPTPSGARHAAINLGAMLPAVEGGYVILPPGGTLTPYQNPTPPAAQSSTPLETAVKVLGVTAAAVATATGIVALVRRK